MARPFIIGLTGGVASGKSTIGRLFSRLGATVINADQLGHEVLNEGKIKNQIRAIWGERVFDAGEVDRGSLGRIVFEPADNREQLAKLEAIIHPRIRERIWEQINEATSVNKPVVVLDIPLLFEADWDAACDKIVFVDADAATRWARARDRGWTEQHWQEREARQMAIEDKKRKSTDVVDNSNDETTTFRQLKSLWISWGLEIPVDVLD